MNKQEYLRSKLINYFSLTELQTLCFDLGIDYDNLRANTKPTLAMDMLDLIIKNDAASNGENKQLQSLIRLMSRQRPNISWSDMPNE